MKSKKVKSKYTIRRNITYILKNVWKWDRSVFAFLFIQAACGVALPALGVYLPKLAIDEVLHYVNSGRLILVIAGITLLLAGISYIGELATSNVNASAMSNRIRYYLLRNLKLMDCDYELVESAEGQTMQQKLSNAVLNDSGGPQHLLRVLPQLISCAAGFFLYSGIITTLNPAVMLFLILTSALNYFALRYINNYREKQKEERGRIEKKFWYLINRSVEFKAGKDLRLYQIKPWFLQIFDSLLRQDNARQVRMSKKEYLTAISDAVIILLRDGAAYCFLIWYIMNGRIGISDFVLYFGAIAGFGAFVSGIIRGVTDIQRCSLDITTIREYLEIPDKSNRGPGVPLPQKGDLPVSITFRDVSFRYTQNGEYILNHLNLHIAAGQKLALVGANGAGKTTLVKLLCGFYRPTSGEILINETPLQSFNRDELYSLYSAVFQDIMILPFPAAKNIALKNEGQIDRSRVRECLRLAGLSERLPNLDLPLTKVMQKDGIELSGGEQQKLMLARALYKDAPVLLLDEPTAALDPIAESELYQKYNELAIDKTSVFISHRLASTHFCDQIAFIKDGHVAELGTHRELMALGGAYAEMFHIQSHYYREAAANA